MHLLGTTRKSQLQIIEADQLNETPPLKNALLLFQQQTSSDRPLS